MYFQGKKILVAGASGLIGSNLITRLLNEGAMVRAGINRRPPLIRDDRIEYVTADLTRGEECRRIVEGAELVFLCAAYTTGAADVVKTPLAHVTPNILINTQMLEAAYRAGAKKFLWISSSTAYPPSGERPIREEELFSGDPYDKSFFAGWMKRFMEVLCRMYGEKIEKPMTTIVLRPTNVYGPNDKFDPAISHVIPALIRKVVERQDPIEVWGTGEEVRDMVYVDDMVEAMLLAAEKVEGYGVFNIASNRPVKIRDIIELILELDSYREARVVFDPAKPTTFPIRLLDTTKAEAVLGWRATVPLREGIRRTIEWYRQTINQPRPVAAAL